MGVISRLYTFVNGNKAMAQQVNAEFDQLVNAHNSNEGVIAEIQTQISTGLATKAELADVTLGLIPDDTITQQKLAPEFRTALPAQYVKNRIPTSADNYAEGHKIGDAWYIPDITLNNLIPTPLAVSPADFIIQNANSAASGSAITLTCQSGFEYALLRRTITPISGALYCLFASLKLTSDHVLTSIALNDQVIASPVKDTTYNVACVVAEPTQFEVKALAVDGAALNGATVVIDKLAIVNMTADMDGVPFDKAGAEAYFQANPAFLTHKFNNAKTRWYCSDNGVWQSSSQLGDETKALYGVENVDDALKRAMTLSSYMAFCTNANSSGLDAGFGKSNEGIISKLGLQLAMYAWFKGDSKEVYPFNELKKCDTLQEIFLSNMAYYELLTNPSTRDLYLASPWARVQDKVHTNLIGTVVTSGTLAFSGPALTTWNNFSVDGFIGGKGVINSYYTGTWTANQQIPLDDIDFFIFNHAVLQAGTGGTQGTSSLILDFNVGSDITVQSITGASVDIWKVVDIRPAKLQGATSVTLKANLQTGSGSNATGMIRLYSLLGFKA